MKQEKSYGCIAYKRTREGEYVVLMVQHHPGENNAEGHWCFPKGHSEEGESEQETALRELEEETGITGAITLDEYADEEYSFAHNSEQVEKRVRFFFCRVPDEAQVIEQEEEIADHEWLSLEDLEERATYPSSKAVARRAWEVLSD
jgi:bis(5'-nucleosidyl)-tetraphosphatase